MRSELTRQMTTLPPEVVEVMDGKAESVAKLEAMAAQANGRRHEKRVSRGARRRAPHPRDTESEATK